MNLGVCHVELLSIVAGSDSDCLAYLFKLLSIVVQTSLSGVRRQTGVNGWT